MAEINFPQAHLMLRRSNRKFDVAAKLRRSGMDEEARKVSDEAARLGELCRPVIEARIAESEAVLADKEE